jgi:cell wall-associated NlpC family hydrolase
MTFRVDPLRAPPETPVHLPPFPLPQGPRSPSASPHALDADAPLSREPSARADASLRYFIEAARAGRASSELAGIGAIVAAPADIDRERSQAIRAFFRRFTVEVPMLEGAPGETREIPIPFRIAFDAHDRHSANLIRALGGAPSRAFVGYVVAGRATPEQLAAVVKDLARLHPEEFSPAKSTEDIRSYLRTNGVGIDCAGSVQLALFDCRGLSPERGRQRFGLARRLDEDLSRLKKNRDTFAELPNPSELRPGDLIILRKPARGVVGHTVIVSEKTVAPLTSDEAAVLSSDFPALAMVGKNVVRISVASSFGREGPQERTWIFDPSTRSWGDLGGHLFDDDGHGSTTPTPGVHSGPWDHDLEGMYRAR